MNTQPHFYFFGKDAEWIEPNRVPEMPPLPKRTFRQRLMFLKMYDVVTRIAPPSDIDLAEFGDQISKALGCEITSPPEPDDRAIFCFGISYGWTNKLAAAAFMNWMKSSAWRNPIHARAIAVRVTRVSC